MKRKLGIILASAAVSVNLSVAETSQEMRAEAYCDPGWHYYSVSPPDWCDFGDEWESEALCNYISQNYCDNNPTVNNFGLCHNTPTRTEVQCCWGLDC